jgi:hypothetical protein
VTEKSDLQSEKHRSPENSTDEGRMLSTDPVPLNTHPSIRDNLDSDSNVAEESDLHSEKHLSPKNGTDAGRVKNSRIIFRNAFNSPRSKVDIFLKTID